MPIQIKRLDHISMAVPALDPQIDLMKRLFGFRLAGKFENDEGYFGANLEVPGRTAIGWEVLAPRGEDSYLHRFLAGPTGPGLHHMAIQIESTSQAAGVIREEGAEPWGFKERPDVGPDEPSRGVVYMHPRSGGRGYLWQMYAGDPWHQGELFDDEETDTLGIIAVNHLAHATHDREELGDWYERVFGLHTVWRSPGDGVEAGFRTRVLETPTEQIRFEMIEPVGDSFIAKFLETRGEGMHHVTFEVGDWEHALAACRTHGIPTFGERSGTREGARWSEAFIHPRHTGGMLVQFFWQEQPGTWI